MAYMYAMINKETLAHICTSKRVTNQYILSKTKAKSDKLEKWLNPLESVVPTINQAKDLATCLHIPFAALYMNPQDIPIASIPSVRNMRTLYDASQVDDSAINIAMIDLILERDYLISMQEELGIAWMSGFEPVIPSSNDSFVWANEIRNYFGLDIEEQYKCTSTRQFYLYLRERVEKKGIFVHCFTDVSLEEARGFAIYDKDVPIIGINFSLLFGLAVNLNGGSETPVAKFLTDLSGVMLKLVKLVTYYAPVAFFAIFANLVADYGAQITADYGRALLVYYPLCFVYIFTAFPLFAWFGGGRHGIRTMLRHIAKPAVVSLGTCSSVATIPTNLEEAENTGISKDVSEMVVPLGATMHMDGSCFSCVLKIAFVLGVFGQPLGWDMLIPVILVAVLSSVGMSGVPGGGYIGEYIICSIFFPTQMELAFPILVAIGNLVDPPATMINAAGDYVVCYIVSRFADGKDWLERRLRSK